MRRRRRPGRRRGFSILLVCVFLVVMLSMLGATFRQIATTLRVETARSRQVQQRQNLTRLGSRWVASQVLSNFEANGGPGTNPPPSTLPGPDGTTSYNVTCTPDPADPTRATWVVRVTPSSP